jgi:hypothetical protein
MHNTKTVLFEKAYSMLYILRASKKCTGSLLNLDMIFLFQLRLPREFKGCWAENVYLIY